MLSASEKNWKQASKSAFWSSDLSQDAWQQAILNGNSSILKTTLEWMRPDVCCYHLGPDLYKDLWPALRLYIKPEKLFSGVNLHSRVAYYDAWWSKLVCGRSWLYPFSDWVTLTPHEKAILSKTAAALYSPEEVLERFGEIHLAVLDKFIKIGFFRLLDMPVSFGSSSLKKVYFPFKP